MIQSSAYFADQIPSLARANLQAFLNVSGCFASGFQALTELNVQTVRKNGRRKQHVAARGR